MIDIFIRDFHIADVSDHYRTQLYDMQTEEPPEGSPLSKPETRLFAVHQIYGMVNDLSYEIYLGAYFGPLFTDDSIVAELSTIANIKDDWLGFFEAAKKLLFSGSVRARVRYAHQKRSRTQLDQEGTKDETFHGDVPRSMISSEATHWRKKYQKLHRKEKKLLQERKRSATKDVESEDEEYTSSEDDVETSN